MQSQIISYPISVRQYRILPSVFAPYSVSNNLQCLGYPKPLHFCIRKKCHLLTVRVSLSRIYFGITPACKDFIHQLIDFIGMNELALLGSPSGKKTCTTIIKPFIFICIFGIFKQLVPQKRELTIVCAAMLPDKSGQAMQGTHTIYTKWAEL
jgi:hypothetical protein